MSRTTGTIASPMKTSMTIGNAYHTSRYGSSHADTSWSCQTRWSMTIGDRRSKKRARRGSTAACGQTFAESRRHEVSCDTRAGQVVRTHRRHRDRHDDHAPLGRTPAVAVSYTHLRAHETPEHL